MIDSIFDELIRFILVDWLKKIIAKIFGIDPKRDRLLTFLAYGIWILVVIIVLGLAIVY